MSMRVKRLKWKGGNLLKIMQLSLILELRIIGRKNF